MTHELKTINPFFEQVWRGNKTFEVRKNDRDFQVGDELLLKEYFQETDTYGRALEILVSYVLYGGQYGIEEGFCVLGFGGISPRISQRN